MKKKLFIRLGLAVFVLICLANLFGRGWIIYHEGSFHGRVIDAETKEPLEGVVVVALYNVREYGPGGSGADAVDAKEAVSDKNGDFSISPKVYFSLYPFATGWTTEFKVYKPGYAGFPYWTIVRQTDQMEARTKSQEEEMMKQGAVIKLQKVHTRDERLKAMWGRPIRIPDGKMPKLLELMNKEEINLGFEPRQKRGDAE